MSYAVESPVAPAAPAPRRPLPAVVASALLALMGLGGLAYAVATLAVTPGVVDRFRTGAAGASTTDVDGFVTVLWVAAAIGTVLAVILFALCVVLALGLRRGSNGARIGAWVLSGLGLLGGCGATLTVLIERAGDDASGTMTTALLDAYPSGWIGLNLTLAIAQVVGYVAVAVLLLVSPGEYFGRPPKNPGGPQPGFGPGGYPQGAPGYGPGYGTPGYGAPGYAAPGYGGPGYGPAGYGAPGSGHGGPAPGPGYGAPAGPGYGAGSGPAGSFGPGYGPPPGYAPAAPQPPAGYDPAAYQPPAGYLPSAATGSPAWQSPAAPAPGAGTPAPSSAGGPGDPDRVRRGPGDGGSVESGTSDSRQELADSGYASSQDSGSAAAGPEAGSPGRPQETGPDDEYWSRPPK
jgi:hypothetical protein